MNQENRFSGYKKLLSPRKGEDVLETGLVSLTKLHVEFKTYLLDTKLQAVAAEMWINKWFFISILYLPLIFVHKPVIYNLLHNVLGPFLLLCNMNARHHLWGGNVDIDTGKLLANEK